MIHLRIYPLGYALLNELNGTIINVVIQRPLKDLPIQQNTQKSTSKHQFCTISLINFFSSSTSKIERRRTTCVYAAWFFCVLITHKLLLCNTLFWIFSCFSCCFCFPSVEAHAFEYYKGKGTGNDKRCWV